MTPICRVIVPVHSYCFSNGIFFKHEYLRSRAYICLSLSSPLSDRYPNFVLFIIFLNSIEILVLTSWIPASKNFEYQNSLICIDVAKVGITQFGFERKLLKDMD